MLQEQEEEMAQEAGEKLHRAPGPQLLVTTSLKRSVGGRRP